MFHTRHNTTNMSAAAASSGSRWNLTNRNIVVTGASKGIGLATSQVAASLGANVILVARSSDDLAAAIASLPPDSQSRCTPCACDLSTDDGRAVLVSQAQATFGGILHGVVNNAGTNVRKTILEQTDDEYSAIVSLNQHAIYRLCQLLQPMLARGSAARGNPELFGASVVNVGSAAGVGSTGSGAAYGMTKAAIAHLSKILACEWAQHRIRVNCVAPWVTLTPLLEAALEKNPNSLEKAEARTPMRRAAKPEEIADAVVFLLMDASSYVTGQVLSVDGGLSANHVAGPTVEP